MLKLQAEYIFPLTSPPIKNGILLVHENGQICDVINPDSISYNIENVIKYTGVLTPGFVNAHCHLELSSYKGLIPQKTGLDTFIKHLQKNNFNTKEKDEINEYLYLADLEMYKNGIVAVGDVSNSLLSLEIKMQSKLYYHTFVELYGSDINASDDIFNKGLKILKGFIENTPASLSMHSLYAVSEKLLKKIIQNKSTHIFSFHHLESNEELLFFYNKTGKIVERLNLLNVNIEGFLPSGKRPLETYINDLPKDNSYQFVHNIFTNENDFKTVRNLQSVYWCFCPLSNLYIENKLPQFDMFIKSNQKATIGTDSLASNETLSVLDEIKCIQSINHIDTQMLLEWACLNGAAFLKIDDTFGSFDKKKRPGVLHISNTLENGLFTSDSIVRKLI